MSNIRIRIIKKNIKRLWEELKIARRLNNHRLFQRANAILMIADGYDLDEIADALKRSERTIGNWRASFLIRNSHGSEIITTGAEDASPGSPRNRKRTYTKLL